MKFAQQLKQCQLHEWKGHYLPYAELKRRLYEVVSILKESRGSGQGQPAVGRSGSAGRAPLLTFRCQSSSPAASPGPSPANTRRPGSLQRQLAWQTLEEVLRRGRLPDPPDSTGQGPAELWRHVVAEEASRISFCVAAALKALQEQFAELGELRCVVGEASALDRTFLELRRLDALGRLQEAVNRLRCFSELNHAALYKILKKHDKQLQTDVGLTLCLPEILRLTGLHEQTAFDALLAQIRSASLQCTTVEGLEASLDVARLVAGLGNRTVANTTVRAALHGQTAHAGLYFFLGASSALLFAIAVLIYLPEANAETFSIPYFLSSISVFNLVLSMVLTLWAIGVVTFVCQRSHINHLFILDIDPRCAIGHQTCFAKAAALTAMWILLFSLYIIDYKWMVLPPIGAETGFNQRSSFHFVLYPVLLLLASVLLLLWPTPSCRCKYVFSLLRSLGRTATAPLHYVCFADNILGDVLTSLAKPLQDVPAAVCYINSHHPQTKESVHRFEDHNDVCGNWSRTWSSVVINAAPFVFRLLQCARRFYDTREGKHLWNLGKYSASLLVVFVSNYGDLGVWYWALSLFATVYAAIWDIVMDWGLGPRELLKVGAGSACSSSSSRELTLEHASVSQPSLLGEPVNEATAPKTRPPQRLFRARVYWICVFADVIARFSWVHTLMPIHKLSTQLIARTLLRTTISVVEIARRAVWTILRIEYEQVSNAGGFRALLWVPSQIGDFADKADVEMLPPVRLEALADT